MILHRAQKPLKDISKQVEKHIHMGGFPEEKHKTEEKTGKVAQPCYKDLAFCPLCSKAIE